MTVVAPTEEIARQQPTREPSPVRGPMPFAGRAASQALLMLTVGVLGFVAFLLVVSPVRQNNDQDRLYATLRGQLAAETAPLGGSIDPGTPVALLRVPGLNLDDVVVEGTSAADLESGPGHRRDTPLPGQAGVSLVFGRAATFGAPFAQLDRLRPGDRITTITSQGTFTYRVRDVRHDGDPVPPRPSGGTGRLVLASSSGGNVLQHGAIVFVDADLLGPAQLAPPGRPAVIPPEEAAMAGDPTVNIVLVLWLQALGMVLAAVVWARRRWGRTEALLVGAPVVLAVAWNLYEAAARLLPNLV